MGRVPLSSIKWEEKELLPLDVEGSPTTDRKATLKVLREATRHEDITIITIALEEMRSPANKDFISAASVLSGATSVAAMFLRYVGGPIWVTRRGHAQSPTLQLQGVGNTSRARPSPTP